MAGRIRRIFLNVSMANRFDGLQAIAKKADIELSKMQGEDYLIFVNHRRDKLTLLVGPQGPRQRHTMAYVRLGQGERLDMRAIRFIPKAFDGTSIDYNKALDHSLNEAFQKKSETLEVLGS